MTTALDDSKFCARNCVMTSQHTLRPAVICPVCSETMIRVESIPHEETGVRESTYRCEKCAAETIRVQKHEK
jgi:C4-type Zn-finger protein